MFGFYYHQSIRRYCILMGELFNGVQIRRERESGFHFQKVPITYANKERFVAKLNTMISNTSDYSVAKVETILPRIQINMLDMVYDATRKTAYSNRRTGSTGIRFNPVPYKFIFEMGIYTRYEDDMLQIVEQILPYFQPNFCCRIKELHDTTTIVDRDIQITIQSVSMGEEVEGDALTRRRLEWNITFELDGWLYPPVSDGFHGEIRTIYLDFHANEKLLPLEANFESVDFEPENKDQDALTYDGKARVGYSKDTPIPTEPQPSGIRGK